MTSLSTLEVEYYLADSDYLKELYQIVLTNGEAFFCYASAEKRISFGKISLDVFEHLNPVLIKWDANKAVFGFKEEGIFTQRN